MYNLIFVILASVLAMSSLLASERAATPIPNVVGRRMEKLWSIAQSSLKDRRYLRAEKALLTILRLDKRNAAAYNHLGILYSRQREYRDAIECFEIASSIKPSASTLHNLGLVYYETENYEKAAVALQSALDQDDSLAARHIAYAKVLEKLDREDDAIASMEKAVDIEPNQQSLKLMYEMYVNYDREKEAKRIQRRLGRAAEKVDAPRRVKRPNRIVY